MDVRRVADKGMFYQQRNGNEMFSSNGSIDSFLVTIIIIITKIPSQYIVLSCEQNQDIGK